MHITRQNRQLARVGGSVNLFILLLSIIFILYLGADHTNPIEHRDATRKLIKLMLANSLCWIVNLAILIFIVPFAPKWRGGRLLFFYLPSLAFTCLLGVLLVQTIFISPILNNEPDESLITGVLFFVVGVDILSLVAIELILSRNAQADIRVQYANMQVENAELRMKSLEAQHEKLKNQLHPHFLFNSLTALKSLIRKEPDLAEDYLVKLSGFLRFSMSHNEQNVVPLEEELRFSLYYLEMQKIRFREALKYDLQIPSDRLVNAFLPVFSLQLTLENAIKHNGLTQERPLYIGMRYLESGWLLVENNIQAKLTADPASGIGLKNLSDRYKLLTHEDIRIENDAECFRVYLKIIRP